MKSLMKVTIAGGQGIGKTTVAELFGSLLEKLGADVVVDGNRVRTSQQFRHATKVARSLRIEITTTNEEG